MNCAPVSLIALSAHFISCMPMKRLLLLAFFTATTALGQAPAPAPTGTPTDPANPQTNLALLRCKLPGGTYSVAVRAIIAVSTHEYLVDGAVRVTEVNIDTAGSLVARFYHLEPATPSGPVPSGAGAWARAAAATQDSTAALTARHIRWRTCADTGRGMRAAGCEARAEVRVGPDAPARSGTHPVAARRPLAP